MEGHHKSRTISIHTQQFHSDFNIYIIPTVINLPELTHLTSVRETDVFDGTNIFFGSKGLQFSFQSIRRAFIREQCIHCVLIRIFFVTFFIHKSFYLKRNPRSVIQRISEILQIGFDILFTLYPNFRSIRQLFPSFSGII